MRLRLASKILELGNFKLCEVCCWREKSKIHCCLSSGIPIPDLFDTRDFLGCGIFQDISEISKGYPFFKRYLRDMTHNESRGILPPGKNGLFVSYHPA
jgi:hypothetical protein